jgi:hypothetical protein
MPYSSKNALLDLGLDLGLGLPNIASNPCFSSGLTQNP